MQWVKPAKLKQPSKWIVLVLVILGLGLGLLSMYPHREIQFDTLECQIVPFGAPWQNELQTLTIHGNGTCVYRNQGRSMTGNETRPWPARTFEHTLSQAQLTRLKHGLTKTQGLTHSMYHSQAKRDHPTTFTITLHLGDETRQVVCEDDQPEPYNVLIWFIRGLAHQERNLYVLHEGDDPARQNVCSTLAGEIVGLWGGHRMLPAFEIDYARYVPEFQSYVAAPESHGDSAGDQLTAAINVLVHTRTQTAYPNIAALVFHENDHVCRAAITALGRIGQSDFIQHLLEAGERSGRGEQVAWTLIQMGDAAVPDIARVLRANQGHLAYKLIRQIIYRWDELPGPLDERIVTAVQVGLPRRGDPYDAYYRYVLNLVEARPIEPLPMLGRLEYWKLVRYEPCAFLHGWYVVVNGRIRQYGAAPAASVSTERLNLKAFEPRITGTTLCFTTGYTNSRYLNGQAPTSVKKTTELPVPEGSQLETDDTYYSRMMANSNASPAIRMTQDYQILWQGRAVKDGEEVLTLVYIGRLVRATYMAQGFKPPAKPLIYRDPPNIGR